MRCIGHLYLPFVALVMTVSGAVASDADEKKSLQGTWNLVDVSEAGKKREISKGYEGTIVFADDTLTMTVGGFFSVSARFKIDSVKKPKHIDILEENGNEKANLLSIYELDGDTLKIAYAVKDSYKNRAAAFEGRDVMVMTLKKDKPKDK